MEELLQQPVNGNLKKTKYYDSFSIKLIIEENEGIQVYKKNNIALAKEDGNEYQLSDFKAEIKKTLHSFINRQFDHIVVLSGAGSSITGKEGEDAVGKTMYDLAQLIGSDLENDPKHYSVSHMASLSKYHHSDYSCNDFNLEEFISQVIKAKDFVSKGTSKYLATLNRIYELIKDNTSYGYDSKKLGHEAFINVLSSRVRTPNKLTIATTNYDVLFEEAAENIGFSVVDGFTYSSKPHFDSDMFEWNLVKDVPNIKTKEFEYKKKVVNLIKLHGSVTWEKDENEDKIYRKDRKQVKLPVMVFPNSDKYSQSYAEPYFELFYKFQELINRPNTLLITTGFSFGDAHITSMVTRSIKNNHGLSVLITDYMIEPKNECWKSIELLKESGHPIVLLKSSFNDLADYFEGAPR